ncbi:MAG: DUF2283 domain-containing protein [Gammaproteobacteria bacterium]
MIYNPEVDVLRILFRDAAIEESDEDKPGVLLDYDKEGNIVGLEVLNALPACGEPSCRVRSDRMTGGHHEAHPRRSALAESLTDRLGVSAPAALQAIGPVALLAARKTALFCSARTPGDAILRAHDTARQLRDEGITRYRHCNRSLFHESFAHVHIVRSPSCQQKKFTQCPRISRIGHTSTPSNIERCINAR